MERVYLVQRAKFSTYKREGVKGIDTLLDFDYMGSAEFEFGALPQSLKRVRGNIGEYTTFQYSFINVPTKTVNVLCKKSDKELIGGILEQLAEQKLHLKEYCDLYNYVGEQSKYRNSDFWWDIDNDWFFWKPNPDFDTKFKDALLNK